jgi:TonB family protein
MFPQPMSWSEPGEVDVSPLAQPDLVQALEEQIAAGFPPGLALDLVLNELVVRATTATCARSAALALKRGDEMVCRAATGEHAPDLGIPLNTRDGLSGACLRTHKSQLCLDTETDPRVDADASRRLGIRSMLIVPVLDDEELVGVLEVFATEPAEFVDSDQNLLEIFARDVTRIRHAALELEQRPVPAIPPVQVLQPVSTEITLTPQNVRPAYEVWTLILGTLAILLAVALSFIIGSRIGWWGLAPRSASSNATIRPPLPLSNSVTTPTPRGARAKQSAGASSSNTRPSPVDDANAGGLVVYEKGKVVFRVKPAPPETSGPSSQARTDRLSRDSDRAWLAPELGESRLRQRTEPQYPSEALAAHRSGDVVLEVVVGTDGAVTSVRPVSGDSLLVTAAADAVRTWRYEPYRVHGHPAEFQTDVTLKFSLPD